MGSREFFDRYGVALGVLVALVLVVAIVPGNASDQRLDTGFSDDLGAGGFASDLTESGDSGVGETGVDAGDGTAVSTGGGGGTSGGTGGGGGASGGTGDPGGASTQPQQQQQPAAPGAVEFGTGPNCREDGRQKGFSYSMPPCANWTPGTPNGGATFRGVTEDKVVVVRYLAQLDPGTEAILSGARLADDGPVVARAYDTLRRYSNLHYETYGREVVFVDVNASGASESEEAMRADAIKIANDIKPFAVIDGNPAAPLPDILAQELARRGVICLCSTSRSSKFYNDLPPAIFSSLPVFDDYASHVGEYICKKLAGKNATFAGDDLNPLQNYTTTKRKFGIIYLNGARGKVNPEGAIQRDLMLNALGKCGIPSNQVSQVGYIYDPGRNQADVTNVIAKMKGDGVTTVIPIWDPLYPILITQEATRQQYFPEWFMTGTGLSDTTTAGRLYDQLQWQHAFGISPLWVTWTKVSTSTGFREYHHAKDAPAGEEGALINVYRARIETLFRGIHMAGPNLTNDSYARGLFSAPAVGGTAARPLRFMNRQAPTEIKDFVEVFYDADRNGPDERGDNGNGMVVKANNAKRHQAGQWTSDPSRAFDDANTLTVSDNPPGGGDVGHASDGHAHPPDQRCLSCG